LFDDDDVEDVHDEYKSSRWEHKKRFWTTPEKSDNATQKLLLVSSFRKINDNESVLLRVIEVFFRRW
jgi:hypothetical protein